MALLKFIVVFRSLPSLSAGTTAASSGTMLLPLLVSVEATRSIIVKEPLVPAGSSVAAVPAGESGVRSNKLFLRINPKF
ncbi:hypothetical protein CR205_03370 [Alteribacter lacisalsi]|uniref:Secreted protein n=1 Tax=Alteribacter lacisalsi TaxID=2045244 RepID=A0A2W0HVE4_9BACI|nr:hypothetical protein CR205_03370 [Alteribacter lacisalsi]